MERDQHLLTQGYSCRLEHKKLTGTVTSLEIITYSGTFYDAFFQRLIRERQQLHGVVNDTPPVLQLGYRRESKKTICRFRILERIDPRTLLLFLNTKPDLIYRVLDEEICSFSLGRYIESTIQ